MFCVSINEDLTITNIYDTENIIDDVETFPISEDEKDLIIASGNFSLWQYKDGIVVRSEFATTIENAIFNAEQEKKRQIAYQKLSDPIFMQYQRQEATKEEWLASIEQIKQSLPYR